jgi:hypothetical protein
MPLELRADNSCRTICSCVGLNPETIKRKKPARAGLPTTAKALSCDTDKIFSADTFTEIGEAERTTTHRVIMTNLRKLALQLAFARRRNPRPRGCCAPERIRRPIYVNGLKQLARRRIFSVRCPYRATRSVVYEMRCGPFANLVGSLCSPFVKR